MANNDISHILRAWPFDPKVDLIVRKIKDRDGKPKLQMRLDVGLLQMEMTGRPDGGRPHEMESLLDYHLSKLREAEQVGPKPYP